MKSDWLVAVSAVVAATVFLHAPIFVGALEGEPRFFEWDVPEQYWPDLVYLCDALHDGELPYWNPYDRGGYPYYADPQAGLYHPMNWAICAIAGPSPSLGWATARTVFAFFLCGLFGLLWLRRLDVPWSGAILGAVAMEAAPFMRHNWELNLTTALAFLPLMLWAADRAVALRRVRDGSLLAVSVALCAWVGSPPALYLAASFTGLYIAARFVVEFRRSGSGIVRPTVVTFAVASLLCAGLVAAVILPGLTLAAHSVQHGRSFASLAEGGLSIGDLSAIVWPQPGNHLYVGVPILAFSVFGLLRRRSLALFHASVAILAVLLCLGDATPVLRGAHWLFPGARLFRLPHRYEAWLGPSMAALAALGLAEIQQRFRGATWARRLGSAPAGLVLSLILLLDVSRALPADRHTRIGPAPGGDSAAERVLPRAPSTDVTYRYFDEFGISCRSGTRLRRRDFRGYQDPLLLSAYERVVGSLRDAPGLAPQYGVRYALTGPHFIHGWNRHYLPPPAQLLTMEDAVDRGAGVIELPHALPIAYFTDRVVRVADRREALSALRVRAPTPIAFAETGDEIGQGETATMVAASDVRLSRSALDFVVEAPTEGMIVVNEAYYPGWRAEVSGRVRPVERVNALVRGIRVAAGRHRVAMVFAPADGLPLRGIVVLSLLICLGTLAAPAWARYNRRR